MVMVRTARKEAKVKPESESQYQQGSCLLALWEARPLERNVGRIQRTNLAPEEVDTKEAKENPTTARAGIKGTKLQLWNNSRKGSRVLSGDGINSETCSITAH